ncbi:MAG TPA: UDP-N-acetylmuramoyl-L-alanyl-D-glutamate--2,6-diaminopimelate ligase [Cycloclasticus sp.]|jgi:UDP-N-acetylmuramoyl-L-alanyl-D-glutamate--2,6-diaminopimelate ligase|nr:UDP-N-acetylmuramoyl-L-alanyl-D-glutamate--2,6-diaminopimelate ligase [Cycloclasticus sp.]HIL92958.1 UDP-N-acetylmuramoyl-L-alanyl-D-glutamate--2,6-diaminopimelate ligase [Cycloclasticus sp.]
MMPAQQNASLVSLQYLLQGMAQLDRDIDVAEPTVDARCIKENGLFLAVSGSQSHGLVYAEQAISAGAAAIVYEACGGIELLVQKVKKQHDVCLVEISSLSANVSEIAARFYQRPSRQMPVIGVTGTNGKTSVSHFIAQALGDENAVCGVIGTVGWGNVANLTEAINTTPDGASVQQQLAQLLSEGSSAVAMEVSSHGLDQGRVNAVEFQGAVFTNLSHEHLDYHQTMDAYGEAKLALFKTPSLTFVVLNQDDEFSQNILQVLAPVVRVLTFSRSGQCSESNCLFISNEALTVNGLSFSVRFNGHSVRVQSSLLGRFNVDNLVTAMATLIAMGNTLEEAAAKVEKVNSVAGRMQVIFTGKANPTVVVDYAHTPDALRLALLSLREHCVGRLKLVFGCGGNRDEAKRSLMGSVAAELADDIIITNDNPRFESAEKITDQIKSGMSDESAVSVVLDRALAIQTSIMQADAGDMILVAGKGHEAYQQVADGKIAFSDVAEVKKALACRAGEGGCAS